MRAGLAGDLIERETFKRRQDWRGERVFERVRVRRSGASSELCLKYTVPLPGAAIPGRGTDREEAAYHFLNDHPQVGAPYFWGRLDLPAGPSVLVLDFVRGRRLKRVSAPERWLEVAGWLGRLHGELSAAFGGHTEPPAGLPRRDATALEEWARRAMRPVIERYDGVAARAEALLDALAPAAQALGSAPPTLVHGELYCTNILLRSDPALTPFCPFDWETASVGCGTADIAYLGRTEMDVTSDSLLSAYAEGWRTSGAPPQSMTELRRQHAAALAYERVYFLWHAAEHRRVAPRKIEKYLGLLGELLADLPEHDPSELT